MDIVKLPTKRLVLFTGLGRLIQDGPAALQNCADCLEVLSRKVTNLAKKRLSTTTIREQLIGKEASLAPLTQGDFSAKNLIRSVLRSQN